MFRFLPFAVLLTGLTAAPSVSPDQSTPGAINPDVTQDNIQETICHRGWSKSVRPSVDFTQPIKLRLLRQHYPGADPRDFELDHRVPIEDGGCPDCESNLWLEPWRDPAHHRCEDSVLMDAACKDRLENYVHSMICTGRMTLAQGQAIFLGNWVDAYRTYINPGRS
jgi:hypothetical protein